MSKSALLKSSLAKKYWMALTGLFLCTFLIGHLLGNLQLVMKAGEEGKRAFNEYAYFMTHNIFIKILSYVTYISILFHAIDGIALAVQNKKARPQNYAKNNPGANSSSASRNMAVLGTMILIFICTHMVNFWWKMKFSSDPMPMHTYKIYPPLTQNPEGDSVYYTHSGNPLPVQSFDVKNGTELFVKDMSAQLKQAGIVSKGQNPEIAEGYKDLHSVVMAFFGQEGKGVPVNEWALLSTILYVVSMFVLGFHLWHGFSSAFQTLGVNHKRYTPIIEIVGKGFAVLVPAAFAIIPVLIYLQKV